MQQQNSQEIQFEYYSQVEITSVNNSIPDAVISISLITNLPNYSKTNHQLTRSLSEFDILYTSICQLFPQYILPCPAFVSQDAQFIKEASQVFMDSLFSHSQLRREELIRTFIESEFQFTPPPSPKIPWKRKPSSLFSFASYNQVKDIDSFFEQAQSTSTGYESALMNMGKANDHIGRVDVGDLEPLKEVAMKMGTLCIDSTNITGPSLRRIAKIWQNLHELQEKSIRYRQTTLNDELILSTRNVQSVLKSLNYRYESLLEYDSCCKNTQKKLLSIERMRASTNINQAKVDAAIEELAQLKKQENISRELFKTNSEITRLDYTRAKYDQEIHIQAYLARYAHYHLKLHTEFLEFLNQLSL